MRILVLCAPLSLAFLSTDDGTAAPRDATKEPPVAYTLRIDGIDHTIEEGSEVTLEGRFENPKVLLTAGATRRFAHGGLTFEYPSEYAFEAETRKTSRTWTLTGDDVTITYFVFALPLTSGSYVLALTDGEDATWRRTGEPKVRPKETEPLAGNRLETHQERSAEGARYVEMLTRSLRQSAPEARAENR